MVPEGRMCNSASTQNRGFAGFSCICGVLGALGLLAAFAVSRPYSAQEPEKEGLGLVISGKAGAEDIGLPFYAGSKPHKDNSDDSAAARLGMWGGGSGFKIAVVKMDSSDSPEKVAAFYKKALARYGKVLDCSNPSAVQSSADKDDSSETLTCGDDKPDRGGMLFKSGTKDRQHIVGIQPNGKGTIYQLVALGDWKSGGKN
jgi:hypothetical protein